MQLVYLKEGRRYTSDDLIKSILFQLVGTCDRVARPWLHEKFVHELRDAMNTERHSAVRGEKTHVFHYLGLFDFTDSSGHNLTFFFLPKFLDLEEADDRDDETGEVRDDRSWEATKGNLEAWKACYGAVSSEHRKSILLAIDRYHKEDSELGEETEVVQQKRESVLELAVRVLRDYLENGAYIVHRAELEQRGQGEVDWIATIDRCDPLFVDGDPVYVDYLSECAQSDENYYITRLQRSLVTFWGRKLEALGLSSVLGVNIPPVSEEELDLLGESDYQVAQIDRELKIQFVTKARETLKLMKALIQRWTETRNTSFETFSFGMTGVEHLWEAACAKVLGSELEEPLKKFGLGWKVDGKDASDIKFADFMPRITWRGPGNREESFGNDKGSQRSKKAGWRLDFIRTYPPHDVNPKAPAEKLVILDAKYYCAVWRKNDKTENWTISGQPGTPDITKQMYYQMVFQDLQEQNKGLGMVNAFLLPESDFSECFLGRPTVYKSETISWNRTVCAFRDVHLYTVRVPGLRLLERYAKYELANDWFETIVGAAPTSGGSRDDSRESTPPPPSNEDSSSNLDALETLGGDADKTEPDVGALTGAPEAKAENVVGSDSPIDPVTGCISKAFIRDVVSVPSLSCKEEMMKEYVRKFAEARSIEVVEDKKGNLYLTKGQTQTDECYPCLVNHMDTVQEKQGAFVDRHERLPVKERVKEGKTELYVEGMGIGADDKLGCAIALALVDQLPVVKAAFFVEEEKDPGMLGSKELLVEWFKDVGFCLSFDSPERDRSAKTCKDVKLFSDQFFAEVLKPVCDRHRITSFRDELFTDVVQIREKTPVMCFNVGNGGRCPHHQLEEYLIVEDAQAAYAFGKGLLETIGTNRWWFGNPPPGDPGTPPRGDGSFSMGEGVDPVTPENPKTASGVAHERMAADASKAKSSDASSRVDESQGEGQSGSEGSDAECGMNAERIEEGAEAMTAMSQPVAAVEAVKPGFRIVCSKKVEDLASRLADQLERGWSRAKAFQFKKIAVASPNLGNWLQMKAFTGRPKLGAGIEFPFLDDRLVELLKAMLPPDMDFDVVSGRKYPAEILAVVLSSDNKVYQPFWDYIADSTEATAAPQIDSMRRARKAVQLAHRLGDLVDAYEATGELKTLSEKGDENAVFKAERKLVDELFGSREGGGRICGSRGSLRQLFERVKDGCAGAGRPSGQFVPEEVVLFGHTQVTPLQADILAWLATWHDVTVYYPGTIPSKNAGTLENVGMPETWHKANWKTLETLKKSLDAAKIKLRVESIDGSGAGESTYPEDRAAAKKCVLAALQDMLQTGAGTEKLEQDASVQVVGAPGIRREVEMVYNAILGAVWEKNGEDGRPKKRDGVSFSDFAVLVPDMKTYRTTIESVFNGRGQIPYGLVSTTTRDRSSYLQGFLALMDLACHGLNRRRLFAVLGNPCVQLAMGFTAKDVASWREITVKIGAFDGYETADSDERNVSGKFNWKDALRRLRLGQVAEEVDGVALSAFDEDVASRFSVVVETLYRKLAALKDVLASCSSADEKAWSASWAGRLHDILDEFLDVDSEDVFEQSVRSQIVRALNSLQPVSGGQSIFLPVAMVEHAVSAQEGATGGYLRHGVTIGGLKTLARVPFKQVFVLGLGEGTLPGRTERSTLDIRSSIADEERSDVLRPEENRALFLAAVLSARDRLVLSYPNRDLSENAPLYSSSLVRDLVKRVLDAHVLKEPFEEFEGYPLVEFAPAFDLGKTKVRSAVGGEVEDPRFKGILPTYSKTAWAIAGGGEYQAAEYVPLPFPGEPTAKDLAEFVKDPFTAVLKRQYGIAQKGYRDSMVESDSPLGEPDGPVLWELQKSIATGRFAADFAQAQATGQVAEGFLGAFVRKKLEERDTSAVRLADSEVNVFWSQKASDGKRIVCRKFDDADIPPDAVLQPFFEFLMAQAEVEPKAASRDLSLSVKVVDVKGGATGVWSWQFTVQQAEDYLRGIQADYKSYFEKVAGPDIQSAYPTVTYKELRSAISEARKKAKKQDMTASPSVTAIDWDAVFKVLSARPGYEYDDKKRFDKSLVVRQLLAGRSRLSNLVELKEIYEKRLAFPMSGQKKSVQNPVGPQTAE